MADVADPPATKKTKRQHVPATQPPKSTNSKKANNADEVPLAIVPAPKALDAATTCFHEWLVSEGVIGLNNVDLRSSNLPGAGCGVFAKKDLAPEEEVFRIPSKLVLTADKALESPLGKLARAVAPLCTAEFVLTLWVAVGRADTTHPFHTYLVTLPVRF